jgi:hypothetical protein
MRRIRSGAAGSVLRKRGNLEGGYTQGIWVGFAFWSQGLESHGARVGKRKVD